MGNKKIWKPHKLSKLTIAMLKARRPLDKLCHKEEFNFFRNNPIDPKFLDIMATHYSCEKNYKKALECYKKIARMCPNYVVYNDIGYIYGRLSQRNKAKAYFVKSLELNPRQAELKLLLSIFYFSKPSEKKGAAYKIFLKSLKYKQSSKEIKESSENEEKFLGKIYDKWLINPQRRKIRMKFEETAKKWHCLYDKIHAVKNVKKRMKFMGYLARYLSKNGIDKCLKKFS